MAPITPPRHVFSYVPAPPERRDQVDVVVFDTESTGPRPRGDRDYPDIWEIGAVRLAPGQAPGRGRRFQAILHLPTDLPARIGELCHVAVDLPRHQGRNRVQALADFAVFIEGAMLAGHHSMGADGPALAFAYQRAGLRLPPALAIGSELLDTKWLLGPQIGPSQSLENIAIALRLPRHTDAGPAHRALADALITAELLDHLCRAAK